MGVKTGDYGYGTTIPIPGEKLSKGWFLRWYIRKLHILAFSVRSYLMLLWITVSSARLNVGQASRFVVVARQDVLGAPDR